MGDFRPYTSRVKRRLKKTRGPAVVSCYKRVLSDTRISDGALRTFLFMKSRAENGILKMGMKQIAKERGITRKTVLDHIKQLYELRLIGIHGQSARGMTDVHLYFIEDEHFARHLYQRPRCNKNVTPVPSVLEVCSEVQKAKKTPPNVISLEQAKEDLRRGSA